MSTTDKAALLAAINKSVSAPKAQSKVEVQRNAKNLQQSQGINARNAHDLVSNASRAGDVADLREVAMPESYTHKQSLLTQDQIRAQMRERAQGAQEQQDTRSVKSEFDYSSKKKFTDVLGEPNKAQQLARLQKEFQPSGNEASLKSSYRSRASRASQANPRT